MRTNDSNGTIDEMINAFKSRIDELSIDSSTDITASDSNLNTYLVTIGLDLGGPEDGPIFRSGGEELVDAKSPEEAEQIIYDRYGNLDDFDSCYAKLATQEDIDEFVKSMNAIYEEYDYEPEPFMNPEYGYEDPYPDNKDERIWSDRDWSSKPIKSSKVLSSKSWMNTARKLGYSVKELKQKYLDETGFTPDSDPKKFSDWCKNYFSADSCDKITSSSVPMYDYYDFDSDIESSSWTLIDCKSVPDSDGFWTDYTWYQDEEGYNVFVFGDRDLYDPDNSDWDWECESYEEALEWFDDYEGFVDEDIDSCTKPKKNDASKDDLETITSSYDFDPDTYLFDLEKIVYQKIAGPHPCVDDVVMSEDTVWGDGYGVTVSFDPLLEINDYYHYIPYDHLYGDEETDASTIAHYCELSVDFKELDQKVI